MNLAKSMVRSIFAKRQRAVCTAWRGTSTIQNRVAELRSQMRPVRSVFSGLYQYYTKGDVSLEARSALLRLHCETNARFTDQLAALLRMVRPPRRASPVSGVLGDLSVAAQRAIVNSIARNGYHIFDRRLPAELCDEIERFAARTPAVVESNGPTQGDRVIFDARAPISKTYRIPEVEVITNHGIQLLMADRSFLAISELYLRTLPILNSVNMWWSATYGDKPGSAAAQEFHFDFDPPPIWLHFFIYLTDVGPENGPHVIVRGSHIAGHPAAGPLLTRGYVRISDEDITQSFGAENIIELCGKRGTVLAVVTRGFHKGKMPTVGHRLIAQYIYACPPYSGAHGRRVLLPTEVNPALAVALAKMPRVYERYL
jgi:Phytanoyl-CoA dioxygenase (PhyH)